jgi:hypothetical protein
MHTWAHCRELREAKDTIALLEEEKKTSEVRSSHIERRRLMRFGANRTHSVLGIMRTNTVQKYHTNDATKQECSAHM